VGHRSQSGSNAAAIAASVGDPEIVAMILQAGGESQANQTDNGLALFRAVQNNNISLIKQLLASGTDPNVRNEWDFTLWHAVTTVEAAELLVPLNLELNLVDIGGSAPLVHHAFSGNTDIALLLIEQGADVNQANALGTPLHLAVSNDLTDLARALIQFGADLTLVNSAGETAADLALSSPSAEIRALFD
jgi:ankyrin repeat protein